MWSIRRLFLVVAGARVLSLRVRLAVCLIVVIGVSFAYSVVDTHNNPIDAYFSPFTRAWELALGALVAVCTPWLLKVPTRLAAWATWLGLGAILIAAVHLQRPDRLPGIARRHSCRRSGTDHCWRHERSRHRS